MVDAFVQLSYLCMGCCPHILHMALRLALHPKLFVSEVTRKKKKMSKLSPQYSSHYFPDATVTNLYNWVNRLFKQQKFTASHFCKARSLNSSCWQVDAPPDITWEGSVPGFSFIFWKTQKFLSFQMTVFFLHFIASYSHACLSPTKFPLFTMTSI